MRTHSESKLARAHIDSLVKTVALVSLVCGIDAAQKAKLVVYTTWWCKVTCKAPHNAVDNIQQQLDLYDELSDRHEAEVVDCSSLKNTFHCRRFGINKFPILLMFPEDTSGFWHYEGAREFQEMWHALMNNRDDIPMSQLKPIPPSLSVYGWFTCFVGYIMNLVQWLFMSSMQGNVLLGTFYGIAIVASYCALEKHGRWMKTLQFILIIYIIWWSVKEQ